MKEKEKQALNELYEAAKNCPVKGRLYVYEQYEQKLQKLNLNGYDYINACRTLADYLEV